MSRRRPAGSPRTGWARGGRSFSCTASMRQERAWSSRPSRHGWPSSVGWCWSTGSASARRIGPTRPTAGRSTGSSSNASGQLPWDQARPPSTSSRSPCRVSTSSSRPCGASGAVRPHRPHQSHGLRPLQGQRRSDVPDPLPVPAPDGGRPAAVRGPRPAPRDPLVPPPDLRRSGAGPAGVRAVLLADLPAAGGVPSPVGVRLRAAQRSPGGGGLRAALRTRRSSSSGIIRASPIRRLPRRWPLPTVTLSASRSSTRGIFRSWSSPTRRRPSSRGSCADRSLPTSAEDLHVHRYRRLDEPRRGARRRGVGDDATLEGLSGPIDVVNVDWR